MTPRELAREEAYRPDWPPARRHRCEICGDIFECHLCEIRKIHILHSELRLQINENIGLFFVCEDCAPEHLPIVQSISHGEAINVYDYMTGKIIRRGPAYPAAKRAIERRREKKQKERSRSV